MREDPDLSAERTGDVPSMKTSLQDTGCWNFLLVMQYYSVWICVWKKAEVHSGDLRTDVSGLAMAFSEHLWGHSRKTNITLSPFLSTCLSGLIS